MIRSSRPSSSRSPAVSANPARSPAALPLMTSCTVSGTLSSAAPSQSSSNPFMISSPSGLISGSRHRSRCLHRTSCAPAVAILVEIVRAVAVGVHPVAPDVGGVGVDVRVGVLASVPPVRPSVWCPSASWS